MAKTEEKPKKQWDAKPSQKLRHTVVTVAVTLLLIGSGAGAYIYFVRDTQATITPATPAPTVKTVQVPNSQKGRFDEESFSFTLPADWKKTGQLTTGPYRKYSYQATLKNADNRSLDVYIDALPLNMAVNKEVAVHSEGAHLSHGMVSSNCTEFTAKPTPSSLSVAAKWDGVSFLCDMDTINENIIGTSAPGSVNKVELTSVGFTKHSFFFVYTDHNYNPDYGIFYDMLDSFTVK